MKNIIIAVLSVWVLLYLAGAFISWQPNPALWNIEGRFTYSFLAFLLGFFAGVYVYSRKH